MPTFSGNFEVTRQLSCTYRLGRWRVRVKYFVMSIWELIGRPYKKSARPEPVYDPLKVNAPTGFGGVKNAKVVIIQLKPNFNSWRPFTQLRAWATSQRLLAFWRLPLPSPSDAIPETLIDDMPGTPELAFGMPSCSARFPRLVSVSIISSIKRE